jgi:acyl-CoA synthetase (AMP-forming)/AMP-acid ligase II
VHSVEGNRPRTLLATLPFFHIYGMICILHSGLRQGAAIVTMPRFELESYLKAIQHWRIEFTHIVPPIAVALAKHPAVNNYDLSSVRSMFSGAAPLGADLTDAVQQRLNITIRQGYGLTEASPVTHYTEACGESRAGKVGRLVPCTECRIVDVISGQDTAPGEPGEVLIRGPQVMKGYLNNPAATASTLDPDGWLHTGDIGTVDADGFLEIVDRLKELIKVKGCQVAPAELEALLLKHPQIADAAVIPVPDDESGEVPKAFVVPRGELTADEVIAFVRAQVAHFKRVRYVAFVDAIPKSASGKILRRVLVERERAAAADV